MIQRGILTSAIMAAMITAASSASFAKAPQEIFGNPDYLAMSFGGYREKSRDQVPSVDQLKEDVLIMHALGIRIVRTYNTQQYPHAARLIEAIHEIKQEREDFEFYVMVGVWIDCLGAWTQTTDHSKESLENNTAEINAAVEMANEYPDIVKAIAVGNEAMVHWAASYFVEPWIVLKWVEHLQQLKDDGKLSEDVWITSSDNFASWGGADSSYHKPELEKLVKAVDFVSMHSYSFHDTHYNSDFWMMPKSEMSLSKEEQVKAALVRARDYTKEQYTSTAAYIHGIAPDKPIHIGETGWSTTDSHLYGAAGSRAADEYKEALYYDLMREWTNEEGITMFYFEMFDEQWKDAYNPSGSENHFGLINLQGEAKYALWDEVDAGTFKGLTRGGNEITKTFGGDKEALMATVLSPNSLAESSAHILTTMNEDREAGAPVTEGLYVILHDKVSPATNDNATYPSSPLRINAWEGTCTIERNEDNELQIKTGAGEWWGCALEMNGGIGEDLSQFANGTLHFEIKGSSTFNTSLGFQTGLYAAGNQVNNFVGFGPNHERKITGDWVAHSIPMSELNKGANLKDVTSALAFMGTTQPSQDMFYLRNIWFSAE